MKTESLHLATYLNELQRQGTYVFSLKQAFDALGKSRATFNTALYRLAKRGRVKRVRAGFYLIVPLEYQSVGSLPASWFIDDFMMFIGVGYYVALLSAAELQGATHQQVMRFQVITDKPMRRIALGQVQIEFHYRKEIPRAFLQKVQTETGKMLISSPELTACDIIKYIDASGQINNVATVLCELKEKLSIDKLIEYVRTGLMATAHVQRLGYLIDFLNLQVDTEPLWVWVSQSTLDYQPLVAGNTSAIIDVNERWHILVNETVEPDI